MSNEIQVFIDRITKWMNKKVNKYISMMINYTEKLETNIVSELHEGTKWIHKTKQKNVLQKYCTKNSRGYDSNHSSTVQNEIPGLSRNNFSLI